MTQVAFVGVGNMGEPMARRVVSAGCEVTVTDLRRSAARRLESFGARWADTPADAVNGASVVCLSLPGPRQVEEVVLGPGGFLEAMPIGSVLVDHTTNALETVRRVGSRCAERGVGFLDAPVSGGSAGAENGTLAVMVGGEQADVDKAMRVLEAFGNPIFHFGDLGTGTVVKLVNNQLFLCGEILFQEGLVLAAKAGVDLARLMALLERTGVGGAHVQNAPRVLGRQFDGPGFALALAEKDVRLSLDAARELGVPMRLSAAAHATYIEAMAACLGGSRSFATLQILERAAATTIPELPADGE